MHASCSVCFVLLSTLFWVFFKHTSLCFPDFGKKKWHARYCFIIVRALLFTAAASSTNIHLVCISQAFESLTTSEKTLTRHQNFLQTLEISIALSAFPSLGLTQVIYRFPVSKAKIRSARPTRFKKKKKLFHNTGHINEKFHLCQKL